jgi:hypothetical protein
VPLNCDRCGRDPARSRESRAEVEGEALKGLAPSSPLGEAADKGRKGLVDGVGLEVLDIADCGGGRLDSMTPGGKRDGTVPALALRVVGCEPSCIGLENPGLSSDGGMKSGKPS